VPTDWLKSKKCQQIPTLPILITLLSQLYNIICNYQLSPFFIAWISIKHENVIKFLISDLEVNLEEYRDRSRVLKRDRTGQTENRRGDRSGLNVRSVMQLDWCELLKIGKIGEPGVSFFVFLARSLKTTSFCIFYFLKKK
jgi:hypothetical protein